MTKIVSVDQMRAIEGAADASGLTYAQMMEHAGRAVAEAILERVPDIADKHVLALVGSGNNGGDGLVALDLLADAGASVVAYLTKPRGADDPHLARLVERGVLVLEAEQDQRWRVLRLQLDRADLLLDALLGTGFQLPLQGTVRELLAAAKRALGARRHMPYVIAVDCPSGLDCDSGLLAEEALAADLTITLAAAKPGLFRFPGAAYVGELVIGDIGLPPAQSELAAIQLELAEAEAVRDWLPERPRDAHKGTFGRALIVAGSRQYPGAAALAARSAYLVGAGLVTLAVPDSVQALIAPELYEVTWLPLPEQGGGISADAGAAIQAELPGSQAVVLGPGFGQAPATLDFIQKLLQAESQAQSAPERPPWLFDADGLKLLTRIEGWSELLPGGSVLTPHPGELSQMTGVPKDQLQLDRVHAALEWSKRWGHVLVFKGAFTVVASPGGSAYLIPVATPALARAGTGDVLAGAIGGLMAQGVGGFRAAVLGSYLHAQAGLDAERRLGSSAPVLAGNVADSMPAVMARTARPDRSLRRS